jgi:beta-galactosidase
LVLGSVVGPVTFSGSAAAAVPPKAAPSSGLATLVDGRPHRVGWDSWSLLIDGERVFINSGEFHYWRLPSPSLWRDVLEKIKAAGFNAVSFYFDWGYHSPKQGVYDFTGVRDVERLLRLTEKLGLYVIARPGPYINAETDAGGFPGWLVTQAGRARTSDPDYTAAYREWLDHVNPILRRHQITRGGSIILYQVENEYSLQPPSRSGPPLDAAYMQQLIDKVRSDGIDVPLFHNDAVPLASWSSGQGAPDIYALDSYPAQFDCSRPDDWSSVFVGGPPTPFLAFGPESFEPNARRADPSDPVFIAEYQGGSFDPWGGPGYSSCRRFTGPAFQKVFNKAAIANGATLINYYMLFGGTSWGWLPTPHHYTSYDYGATIGEARQLGAKYDEQKRLAYMIGAVAPLRETNRELFVTPSLVGASNPVIGYRTRTSPTTGTLFFTLRHHEPTSRSEETTTLALAGRDGVYPRVPQQEGTAIRIAGRDAKLLVAGYDMEDQRLVYSTSELMTHARIGARDVAVLYGRPGEDGETVLRYSSRPDVRVLAGEVSSAFDAGRGDLRLNYTHRGLARVLLSGGERPPLMLLVGTDDAVARLWRQDTPAGPLLELGPYLVRSAAVRGATVKLRGDTDAPTRLELLAAPRVTRVRWNGRPVRVRRTDSGWLLARLPGPGRVRLPRLARWRFKVESPERKVGFDDRSWLRANRTQTNNPTKPQTLPVLYMDEYGFHYGNVWYRGHFTARGGETAIALHGDGGPHAQYAVWLNGAYLGSSASGQRNFALPRRALRRGADNVVSVLVESMGHDQIYGGPTEGHKAPRGLRSARLIGSDAALRWRIKGARGGESLTDVVRGAFNNGGLYGERSGWHLPRYPDRRWRSVRLPYRFAEAGLTAGVAWYRRTFRLSLPRGHDVPLGLLFTDAERCRYRAQIFLNGWHLGRYINELGPQRLFYLPEGILIPRGRNQLAISSWAERANCGGLGRVKLRPYGNYASPLNVETVPSPPFRPVGARPPNHGA